MLGCAQAESQARPQLPLQESNLSQGACGLRSSIPISTCGDSQSCDHVLVSWKRLPASLSPSSSPLSTCTAGDGGKGSGGKRAPKTLIICRAVPGPT